MKTKLLFIAATLFIICGCSKNHSSVIGTKWEGTDKSKGITLLLYDSNGKIIKKYSETDADTFKISFEQKGDSLILLRDDDIVSTKQTFIITSDSLISNDFIFIKQK